MWQYLSAIFGIATFGQEAARLVDTTADPTENGLPPMSPKALAALAGADAALVGASGVSDGASRSINAGSIGS